MPFEARVEVSREEALGVAAVVAAALPSTRAARRETGGRG
jgi:hypothetical protein